MKRSELPPRRVALARTVKLTRQPAQAVRKRPKRSGRGNSIPQPSRDAVKARSGGQCEIGVVGCTGQATDWHHRLRRREGNHSPANGLHACANCHRFAHAHPAISRLAGWIVPSWETPEATPVRIRGRGLCWLLEDGRIVGEGAAA